MPDAVPVADFAALAPGRFAALAAELSGHTSARRVLDWCFARTPPAPPADLVAMDEFSYDLLVPLPGGVWLSYDTS